MASLLSIAKKKLEETKKKAKKKLGGIKLDEGLKRIVSSVGQAGLQVGAKIQEKLPKEVTSPAETFKKVLTEKPELTPMGIAKGIFKQPRLMLEASNIVTGGVEAGVRGLAERTPLKKVKVKIPKTGIELTAPGVLGFGAALAVPIPGGAKVKGVSKIAKLTKIEEIAAELTKMKGLKITAEEIPTLAKKLVKPKTAEEVSGVINKFVTKVKPAKAIPQATKGVEPLAQEARITVIQTPSFGVKGAMGGRMELKEMPDGIYFRTTPNGHWKQSIFQSIDDAKFQMKMKAGYLEVPTQATKGVEGVTQKGIQRAVGKLTPEGLPAPRVPSLEALKTPVQEQLAKTPELGLRPAGNVPSAIAPSGGIVPQLGKERGFVTTVKGAKTTTKDVANKIKGFYSPNTTDELITKANYWVKTRYDVSKSRVLNEPLTAETNAIGQEIMRQAQNAGRFDEAVEIAEVLARKGTQAGQTVQAFSNWARLTPEGMLRYAQKEFLTANQKLDIITKAYRGLFRRGEVKLTSDDAKVITGLMDKANLAGSEEEKATLIRQAFEYIGKKMPWGVSDVLDEYRYNNMLSNPLTIIFRNALNNAVQTYFTRPSTIAAQGKISSAIKYEIGALKALPDGFKAFGKAIKENASFGKMDIIEPTQMGAIKPKRLGIYNLPSATMEATDRFFRTLIKSGEMMTGKTEQEAAKIAEYTLFRADLNPAGQGYVLNSIDNVTKAIFQLRKVGLGWFIPFLRTPMNVAKQWIEYSPAGVLTLAGATAKREQLAKTLLGSIATGIGASLALEGKTTWAAPTDPKAKALFYDSGRKPYSIKIGDKWVPLQTLGVFAWATGLPAAIKYYQEEAPTAFTDTDIDKITKMIISPIGFWSNQTFVSGLASFVKLAEGDTDYSLAKNLGYVAGQLKPFEGLMRYVATVIDPVFRKPKNLQQQLMADIPGLTRQLPAYKTSTGEEARRNITNYLAPYAMGQATQEFEEPYQQRTYKLQYNAIMRQVENGEISEEEGQRRVNNLLPNLQLESESKTTRPSLKKLRK